MAKVIEDYVNLTSLHITELPEFLKDVQIRGSGKSYYSTERFTGFNISNNKLTSLKNCPSVIGGDFLARNCKLKSLVGGPNYVAGHYIVEHNRLTSLEGMAHTIGGNVNISYNPITSLKHLPVSLAYRNLTAMYTKLVTLEHCPKNVQNLFLDGNHTLMSFEGCPDNISHLSATGCSVDSFKGLPNAMRGSLTITSERNFNSLDGLPGYFGNTLTLYYGNFKHFIGEDELIKQIILRTNLGSQQIILLG